MLVAVVKVLLLIIAIGAGLFLGSRIKENTWLFKGSLKVMSWFDGKSKIIAIVLLPLAWVALAAFILSTISAIIPDAILYPIYVFLAVFTGTLYYRARKPISMLKKIL